MIAVVTTCKSRTPTRKSAPYVLLPNARSAYSGSATIQFAAPKVRPLVRVGRVSEQ